MSELINPNAKAGEPGYGIFAGGVSITDNGGNVVGSIPYGTDEAMSALSGTTIYKQSDGTFSTKFPDIRADFDTNGDIVIRAPKEVLEMKAFKENVLNNSAISQLSAAYKTDPNYQFPDPEDDSKTISIQEQLEKLNEGLLQYKNAAQALADERTRLTNSRGSKFSGMSLDNISDALNYAQNDSDRQAIPNYLVDFFKIFDSWDKDTQTVSKDELMRKWWSYDVSTKEDLYAKWQRLQAEIKYADTRNPEDVTTPYSQQKSTLPDAADAARMLSFERFLEANDASTNTTTGVSRNVQDIVGSELMSFAGSFSSGMLSMVAGLTSGFGAFKNEFSESAAAHGAQLEQAIEGLNDQTEIYNKGAAVIGTTFQTLGNLGAILVGDIVVEDAFSLLQAGVDKIDDLAAAMAYAAKNSENITRGAKFALVALPARVVAGIISTATLLADSVLPVAKFLGEVIVEAAIDNPDVMADFMSNKEVDQNVKQAVMEEAAWNGLGLAAGLTISKGLTGFASTSVGRALNSALAVLNAKVSTKAGDAVYGIRSALAKAPLEQALSARAKEAAEAGSPKRAERLAKKAMLVNFSNNVREAKRVLSKMPLGDTDAIMKQIGKVKTLDAAYDMMAYGSKRTYEAILAYDPTLKSANKAVSESFDKVVEAQKSAGLRAAKGAKLGSSGLSEEAVQYVSLTQRIHLAEVASQITDSSLHAAAKEALPIYQKQMEDLLKQITPEMKVALDNYVLNLRSFYNDLVDWAVAKGLLSEETIASYRANPLFADNHYMRIMVEQDASKIKMMRADGLVKDDVLLELKSLSLPAEAQKFVDPEIVRSWFGLEVARSFNAQNLARASLEATGATPTIMASNAEIKVARDVSSNAKEVTKAAANKYRSLIENIETNLNLENIGELSEARTTMMHKVVKKKAAERKVALAYRKAAVYNFPDEQVSNMLKSAGYQSGSAYNDLQVQLGEGADGAHVKRLEELKAKGDDLQKQIAETKKAQEELIANIKVDERGTKIKNVEVGDAGSADLDYEIADRISAMNKGGYTTLESHSGIAADHADPSLAGRGNIKFSGDLDEGRKAAIEYAAERSGLDVREVVDDKYGPILMVSQTSAADGTSNQSIIATARRNLYKNFGIPESEEWLQWMGAHGRLNEGVDWWNKEVNKLYNEHGGYAQPNDKARRKSWDEFFDSLGYRKNGTTETEIAERLRGLNAKLARNVEAQTKLETIARTADAYDAWYKEAPAEVKKWLKEQRNINLGAKLNESNGGSRVSFEQFSELQKDPNFGREFDRQTIFSNKDLMNSKEVIGAGKKVDDNSQFLEDLTEPKKAVEAAAGESEEAKAAYRENIKNIKDATRGAVDEFVAGVAKDGKVAASAKAISEYGQGDQETIIRYLALQELGKKSNLDQIKAAVKKKALNGLPGKTSKRTLENYSSAIDEAIDALVREEYNNARLALDSVNSKIIDKKEWSEEIRKLHKKISDVQNMPNVIKMSDGNGGIQLAEVSPNLAFMYNYRPRLVARDGVFDKIFGGSSKLYRLGQTTFSAKSFVMQAFRDSGNAYFMGNAWRDISSAADYLVDVFGENIVAEIKQFDPEHYEKLVKQVSDSGQKVTAKTLAETEVANIKAFGEKISPASTPTEAYATMGRDQAFDKMKNGVESFIDKIDGIFNGKREEYLRNRVFMNALADAMKEGRTYKEAQGIAIQMMNNATTNFSRSLYHLDALAENVPYIKAAINGTTSFWRMFSLDPVGVIGRISGGLFVPYTYLLGQSLSDPENRDIYAKIPEYEKRDSLVFVVRGQKVSIPIPQELAPIIAPFRHFVEYLYDAQRNNFWDLLGNDILGLSPVDLTGFSNVDMNVMTSDPTIMDRLSRGTMRLISQLAPVPVKAAWIIGTQTDPYTGKRIADTSWTYQDPETGEEIPMGYNQGAFAERLAALLHNDNAALVSKVVSSVFGTTGEDILDALAGLVSVEGITGTDPIQSITKNYVEPQFNNAVSALYDETYDRTQQLWRQAIRELEIEKDQITESKEWKDLHSAMSQAKTDAALQKLRIRRQEMIDQFNQKVADTATRLQSVYGGTLDRSRLGAVTQLLNFSTNVDFDLSNQQLRDIASEVFYAGSNQAVRTMYKLGIKGATDNSIFGYYKVNTDGSVGIKYTKALAIMDLANTVYNAKDIELANIKSVLEENGITRGKMFSDEYYAAQTKAAKKAYKADWNKRVVYALYPYISSVGIDEILNNTQIIDYLDQYIFVDNPYKAKDYIKKLFKGE